MWMQSVKECAAPPLPFVKHADRLNGRVIARMTFVAVLTGVLGTPALAEPCNPVIDGTYCATDMVRRPNVSTSGSKIAPMQGIARDMGSWTD